MAQISSALQALRQQATQSAAAGRSYQSARDAFCVRAIPNLASTVRQAMAALGDELPGKTNDEVAYNGTTHAAWKLTEWPPHDLPAEVRSYAVFLLDSAQVVSKTVTWDGQEDVEECDPTRYQTSAVNPQSIYLALAGLLGDYYFKKEHISRMP